MAASGSRAALKSKTSSIATPRGEADVSSREFPTRWPERLLLPGAVVQIGQDTIIWIAANGSLADFSGTGRSLLVSGYLLCPCCTKMSTTLIFSIRFLVQRVLTLLELVYCLCAGQYPLLLRFPDCPLPAHELHITSNYLVVTP